MMSRVFRNAVILHVDSHSKIKAYDVLGFFKVKIISRVDK